MNKMLSKKEQKLLDFIKNTEHEVTAKVIMDILGENYLRAIGKLMQNELIEKTKKKIDCPTNPYGTKFVKIFTIREVNNEEV